MYKRQDREVLISSAVTAPHPSTSRKSAPLSSAGARASCRVACVLKATTWRDSSSRHTVSYTHLDVYKRQPILSICPRGSCSASKRGRSSAYRTRSCFDKHANAMPTLPLRKPLKNQGKPGLLCPSAPRECATYEMCIRDRYRASCAQRT